MRKFKQIRGEKNQTNFPFSQSLSVGKPLDATTVVVVQRSSWFIVTLTDELSGRLCFASRFPQYFITAMLDGEEKVTECKAAILITAYSNKMHFCLFVFVLANYELQFSFFFIPLKIYFAPRLNFTKKKKKKSSKEKKKTNCKKEEEEESSRIVVEVEA